jgi:hypothetical protein
MWYFFYKSKTYTNLAKNGDVLYRNTAVNCPREMEQAGTRASRRREQCSLAGTRRREQGRRERVCRQTLLTAIADFLPLNLAENQARIKTMRSKVKRIVPAPRACWLLWDQLQIFVTDHGVIPVLNYHCYKSLECAKMYTSVSNW